MKIKEEEIEKPSHYKMVIDGKEINSIEITKSLLGKRGFKSFCIGNALKYLIRAEKKNGLEDYKKAKVYLEWIIEGEEKE